MFDNPPMTRDTYTLDGITVLDLTTFVTGGFCTLMLANQGAEVIKIERPDTGDDNRHSGPPFIDGESPYFWTVNYGKKSIELDLTTDEGTEALYTLVEKSDVLVQNYRPGTAAKLDVDYESVRECNDSLVYVDISAFGGTGPWRERPGYDLLVQGMSGIMSVTGEPQRAPVKVGLPITDLITAMWAAFGVMNGLYRRTRTGDGEYIDIGMLEATLPWLTKQAGKVFAEESPDRMGTKDPVLAPYQTYETADGFINVCCLNRKLWSEFCEAIDRPELIEDPRFETNADRVDHMDSLEAELTPELASRTTEEWMEILAEDAGIPAGPVFEIEEALYNAQCEARGVVQEMDHPDHGSIPVIEHPLNYANAQSGFETPPPSLGEHTREVLEEAGYTERELTELANRGVFGRE